MHTLHAHMDPARAVHSCVSAESASFARRTPVRQQRTGSGEGVIARSLPPLTVCFLLFPCVSPAVYAICGEAACCVLCGCLSVGLSVCPSYSKREGQADRRAAHCTHAWLTHSNCSADAAMNYAMCCDTNLCCLHSVKTRLAHVWYLRFRGVAWKGWMMVSRRRVSLLAIDCIDLLFYITLLIVGIDSWGLP